MSFRILLIAGALCVAILSGCASSADKGELVNKDPPEIKYAQADKLLGKDKYREAAKKFEEVDRDYPYSPYARRAIAMSAFAYYNAELYPEAIQAAKRYTTLHPGTKESALAQYIIAMSLYDQITDPARDQAKTVEALKEMEILVRRHPKSSYAAKVRNRVKIAIDMLAAKEMKVARYYLDQKTFLAAINRYRIVITKYQKTVHVEEALMRVAEAYMALGIQAEAQTATAVLGHNFPESKWYQYAYKRLESGGLTPRENKSSWISRAWRKVKPGSG